MKRNFVFLICFILCISACTKSDESQPVFDKNSPPISSLLFMMNSEDAEQHTLKTLAYCLGYGGDEGWTENFEEDLRKRQLSPDHNKLCLNAAAAYAMHDFSRRYKAFVRKQTLSDIVGAGPDKAHSLVLSCTGYRADEGGQLPALPDEALKKSFLEDTPQVCRDAVTAMLLLDTEHKATKPDKAIEEILRQMEQ